MAACTSKHRQVCTHCGIRWERFPKLFASYVHDFIFINVFVRFQITAGLPPQLEGLLFSVTPTYFEIPLKDETQISEYSIIFYQCFPQDNIRHCRRRPLSTHIKRHGLAVEIPQEKWWPSIRVQSCPTWFLLMELNLKSTSLVLTLGDFYTVK